MTAPSTPSPYGTGAAGAGGATTPSAATGLGGGLGGPSGALVMIGDQGPMFGVVRPPVPPPPPFPQPGQPPPPRSFAGIAAAKGEEILPWVRGFKIADNMSPRPQDRVFFTFNYFQNLNYAVNGRIQAPVADLAVYRYIMGFEKTFWDGNASIGLRDSINTLSAKSPVPGLGGTNTAMGDLTFFSKFVLWQNWENSAQPANPVLPLTTGPANGGLVSGGLAVTMPTGPGSFAGAPASKSFRDAQLQPFLGYFFSRGNLYFQGFEAINVPLDARDVTMLFTDVGLGYYFYRSPEPESWLSAAAATFEVHVNDPLNHRHPFALNDLAGTADVVDLTYGTNFMIKNRSLLSLALVSPISGPRPFNVEAVALLNVYFGGTRSRRAMSPPVLGN